MATPAPGSKGRLFVTGASGYIGLVLAELAVREGYAVRGLSRSESGDAKLRAVGAESVRGDLAALDVLRRESAAATAVINLASAYTLADTSYQAALPVDNAAFDAMAEGLREGGVPDRVIVTTGGTLFAAPDPAGRLTTEDSPLDPQPINVRHLHEAHALAVGRRPGSPPLRAFSVRLAPYVYGRGGSGVALFMGLAPRLGGVPCVDGGGNRTTVVHVDDAARLYLRVVERGPPGGGVYNGSAADDQDVTARQIAEAAAQTVGGGVAVRDMPFEEAVAGVGEMLARFLRAENRASGMKARRELGWEPQEVGILEDIRRGSYVAVAERVRREMEAATEKGQA